ncbi:uncharacterized protein L969DRAFT_71614 [Mixia osmundae IAM 14324]|uniref:DNA polymerase kappa n=1 Tax=Mixia osmundae (strain CBS 9802 / IAM 14324 / JCM 22182 / KY 12970) TaxID=764103 RepID=G7DU09_MIXOS|nr:uncharacterized protein L969DRAFT_71614 [Mixia osmundae IAM 14324]KEI41782.1 hypothetical protein L969DRAFT_71614 [Mixia osmundae IAM 14324]GAA94069.1 hypothetical protein E5Q_00716 [Mixia osmundae IAM 14324]
MAGHAVPEELTVAEHLPGQLLPKSGLSGKGKARQTPHTAKEGATESFLHRLAGPSTGKSGLTRDPAEVRQIIWEASKGSAFAQNEQRRDEATQLKIKVLLDQLSKRVALTNGNLRAEEIIVEAQVELLEATRDLSQTIVVVDCDAFYASVEELDDPSLKGKAFAVGVGVCTTASYEARKYGVRSALAGYIAKKLCPHLIFVKPDFTKYSQASARVMAILRKYDPHLAPASLDEAYLNITVFMRSSGLSADDAVMQMRTEIKETTGLTVSAGIAPNTLLAKMAADVNKPDGQCRVMPTRDAVVEFTSAQPVRKIFGVGRVTEAWLVALDVRRISDIWAKRGMLHLIRTSISLDFLLKAYLGLGSSLVSASTRESRKSVGREDTFGKLADYSGFLEVLRALAETLGNDCQSLQFAGRTLTLKFKLSTYEPFTRARTIGQHHLYRDTEQFYKVGKELLDEAITERRKLYDDGKTPVGCGGTREIELRLLGLRITNLVDQSEAAIAKRRARTIDHWAVVSPKGVVTPVPTESHSKRKRSETPLATHTRMDESGAIVILDDEEVDEPRATSVGSVKEAEEDDDDEVIFSSMTSTSGATGIQCPICHKSFLQDMAQLNRHLDACLVKQADENIAVTPGSAFDRLMKAQKTRPKTRSRKLEQIHRVRPTNK